MQRPPVLVLAVFLCSLSAFADVRLQPSRLDIAGLRAFGDFNGDGLDDVLNHSQLYFNLGGRFAPAIEVSNIPPMGIQSAQAVSFPLGFYVELTVRDATATRQLEGWLTPTADGLKGKLYEYKPACGGRYVSHKITAIPTH